MAFGFFSGLIKKIGGLVGGLPGALDIAGSFIPGKGGGSPVIPGGGLGFQPVGRGVPFPRLNITAGPCPPGFRFDPNAPVPARPCVAPNLPSLPLTGPRPLGLVNGGAGGPCNPPLIPDPQGGGFCIFPGSPFAGGRIGFGEAVMGQFGAALVPDQIQSFTRRCPRGAVLGLDGLCYNRGTLRNKERLWPKGTAPLLTGGEMRCISIAARAAGKLGRKQKQLMKMGMLPKPTSRRLAKAPHPALLVESSVAHR